MSAVRDLEPELLQGLHTIERHSPYAEVMASSTQGRRLRMDRDTVNPQPVPTLAGFVFRAWTGEAWEEAAASGLTASAVASAAEQLVHHLPGTASSRGPPGPSATGRAERTTEERRPIDDFGLEDSIAWAKTRFQWATSVSGISNAIVNLQFAREERLFLSTVGAARFQRMTRSLATVVPLAIEGAKVEFDALQLGETGGVEVIDRISEAEIVEAAREAKALLNAKPAPVGPMTVILDPSTSGTFAHESFGHGTEADQILRERSYLAPLLGQEVGPEFLSIVDDGTYPNGWGSIFYDDEGNESHRTVLIDHGRFVEVLHDRESAAALGRPVTGNARRADFLSRPFVRMTNTYVVAGDRSFDELVAEAKEGVVLQHFTSGIEDPLGGNMQLKVKKGRRIEHGEMTDILPSMALSGKVLDFLRSIRGVSKASDFDVFAGFCGKGHTDILPTGAGGPYVLAHAVVGPA